MVTYQTLFATLITFAIGVHLFFTHADYSEAGLFSMALFALGGTFTLFVLKSKLSKPISIQLFEKFLGVMVSTQLLLLIYNNGMIYARNSIFTHTQNLFLNLALISFVAALFIKNRLLFACSIALVLISKFLVIFASPTPSIDVHAWVTQAVDVFLQKQNPYTFEYADPFQSESLYGYSAVFAYWPGLLYILAPFRALNFDMRVGLWFSELITALVLFRVAYKKLSNFFVAGSLAFLWVSFPVSFFVLEQAWIDSFILATALSVYLSLRSKKVIQAGLWAGFALSIKQYALFYGFFAFIEIFTDLKKSALLKFTGAAAIVFLLVTLPFVIIDSQAFYDSTIGVFQNMPIRLDALTFRSWSYIKTGHDSLSFLANPAIFLIFIGAISATVFKRVKTSFEQNAQPGFYFLASSAVFYAVIFMFGRHSFCNQYYFLAFWPLLMALDSLHSFSDSCISFDI